MQMKYVSEALSNIYIDMGSFTVAEEYLLGAISTFSKKNQTPSDQRTFQLYYNLARIYLKSYHFERAVLLLESLMHYPSLPKSKFNLVVLTLAQVCILICFLSIFTFNDMYNNIVILGIHQSSKYRQMRVVNENII